MKTFQQLNAEHDSILVESEWTQHKNGGGWYRNTKASVHEDAYLGEFAIVWGGTIEGGTIRGGTIEGGTIEGGTIWGGTIKGGTIWGGTIKGGTIWGGTIEGGTIEGGTIRGGTIWGGTIRGGTIWGGTIWGGTIEGGEWKKSVLFLMDSRGHGATNSKPGHLRIGCELHTFKEWQDRFDAIAHKHSLDDEERVEYLNIVNFFAVNGK